MNNILRLLQYLQNKGKIKRNKFERIHSYVLKKSLIIMPYFFSAYHLRMLLI